MVLVWERTTRSITLSAGGWDRAERVSEGCPRPPRRNLQQIWGLDVHSKSKRKRRKGGHARSEGIASAGHNSLLRGECWLCWMCHGSLASGLWNPSLSPPGGQFHMAHTPIPSPPSPQTPFFFSLYNSCVFCFQSGLLTFKSRLRRFAHKGDSL